MHRNAVWDSVKAQTEKNAVTWDVKQITEFGRLSKTGDCKLCSCVIFLFFFINIATFSGEFIRFGEQCLDLSFLFLMEWSRYEEAFWGYAQLCNSTDPCNFTEEKGGINEKGDHRWNNAFKIFSNEKFLPVGKTSMLMPA